MDFDQAFLQLIGHEGGYVNNPHDPGGETKYGISRRAYPQEDIAGMTLERAKLIYHRDYWGPAGCSTVPPGVRFDLFDMAVNAGVRAAIKALQRTVQETPDGILGPRTLAAVSSMSEPRLIARFNGQRLAAMTELDTWATFGRGWARRIATNLQRA